jgi:hypothetical protein
MPDPLNTEGIRKGREEDWFRQHEATLIEEARRRRREAERENKSAEVEALRKAHWHKCPKCGHDRAVESIAGIEIEKCSSCEGIFFDRGELEELLLKHGPERRGFFRRLIGLGEG